MTGFDIVGRRNQVGQGFNGGVDELGYQYQGNAYGYPLPFGSGKMQHNPQPNGNNGGHQVYPEVGLGSGGILQAFKGKTKTADQSSHVQKYIVIGTYEFDSL